MLMKAGADKDWAITNHGLRLTHTESDEGHVEVTNGSETGTGKRERQREFSQMGVSHISHL